MRPLLLPSHARDKADPRTPLACAFPIIARRFPKLSIPHRFLFLSRHFGTGVLIATAFVHLLPTAFVSLTDPCLPHFWNKGYPAMPGAIAMASVLVVVGIEMFFATKGAGHAHGSGWEHLPGDEEGHQHEGEGQKEFRSNGHVARNEPPTPMHKLRHSHGGMEGAADAMGREPDARVWDDLPPSSRPLLAPGGPQEPDSPALIDTASDYFGGTPTNADPDAPPPSAPTEVDSDDHSSLHHPVPIHPPRPSHLTLPYSASASPKQRDSLIAQASSPASPNDPLGALTPQALQRKLLLQCLLLEAGILFHSVFIGMSVSVSTGPPFVVLLVAIAFHQTFEGLALGARIAAIPALAPTSPKPWLMALAYGTTTPVGQAIGLSVHSLYDPKGTAGLLMVGVMNAISSGLLLFAGLVELLAEDFLSDESYQVLKGKRRLEACAAVVSGSLLMAIVGAFA